MDASVSSSFSIHSSSYSLASILLKLTRSLSMLKIVCNRFLMLFSISRNFDRISVLFFSANNSKFATKSIMRDCGSLSHKKMGFSSKLDEIDTDMGSCFPIQFIVSVGFSSSDGTQIYSKSKIATFLNKVCSFVYSKLNPSSFSNNLSRRV